MTLNADDQLQMFGGAPTTPRPEAPAPGPEAKRTTVILGRRGRHVAAGRALALLQRSLPTVQDPDPPGLEGWRGYLDETHRRPRIVDGVCSELAERRQADGALAPCPRVLCPHHLLLDRGEVVQVGDRLVAAIVASAAGRPAEMGRRPALSPIPTHSEHSAFDALALERLTEIPRTCSLEVVAAYPDGAPLAVIADALGLSEEEVRRATNSAAAALFDETCSDAIENLAEAAPREVRAPRPAPVSKIADPAPVPAAIVRVEREALAPAEPSADEIFTF